jgi:hypothetical protein
MKTKFALIISHRHGLNVNVYATDKAPRQLSATTSTIGGKRKWRNST